MERSMQSDTVGSRALWANVLKFAICDLKHDLYSRKTEYWFNKTENEGPGSFVWICFMLDLDADSLRRKILHERIST